MGRRVFRVAGAAPAACPRGRGASGRCNNTRDAEAAQPAIIDTEFTPSSGASVPAPEPFPAQSPPTANHSAVDIAGPGRDTPCRSAIAAPRSRGTASQSGAADKDVAVTTNTGARAQQVYQSIPCGLGAGIGAGMARRAGAIHLARCNSRQPDAWSLLAPDRAITIPYVRRRAGEHLASGNG